MFGRRDLDLENFFHSFLSSYTPLKLNMGTHLKIGAPFWSGNPGDSELGVPIMAFLVNHVKLGECIYAND